MAESNPWDFEILPQPDPCVGRSRVVPSLSSAYQQFAFQWVGLPSPVERCMQVTIPGWRITVEGTPGQKQIYRIDSTGQRTRTEAIAGLPARTDELPTTTAKLILKNASDRLSSYSTSSLIPIT